MAGVLEKEKRKYAVGPGRAVVRSRRLVKRTMWIILLLFVLCGSLVMANNIMQGTLDFAPAKAWFIYE